MGGALLLDGLVGNEYRLPTPGSHRDIQRWLDDLPLTNTGHTANQLHAFVERINDSALSPKARIQTLQLVLPTIHECLLSLELGLQGAPVPLPVRQAETATFCQQFYLLMAGICLGVVRQWVVAGRLPLYRRRAGHHAMHLAMIYLGRAQELGWLSYRETPVGLWKDLNWTYAVAVASRLALTRVREPEAWRSGPQSIQHLYLESVLRSIADPHRLSPQEILAMPALLAPHLDQVRVAFEDTGCKTEFKIHLSTDRPPGFERHYQHIDDLLRIGIDDVAAALHEVTAGLEVQTRLGESVRLQQATLDHMAKAVGSPAERNFRRLGANYSLLAVLGMRGIHYNIGNSTEFGAYLPAELELASTAAPANWVADRQAIGQPEIVRTFVLNQSRGGYRLLFDHSSRVRARVGELIGVALPYDDDEPPIWMVGQTRWVRVRDDGDCEVGVSVMSRSACAVALSFDGEAPGEKSQRGLFLRDYRQDDERIFVLAEQTNLGCGTPVSCSGFRRGVALSGIVEECIERTDCFALYALEERGQTRSAA